MLCAQRTETMTDLKDQLAALLASSEGKALIERGQEFSTEELQAAFGQVLAEVDADQRIVVEAAFKALIARRAN
jgi:hypothetical protein